MNEGLFETELWFAILIFRTSPAAIGGQFLSMSLFNFSPESPGWDEKSAASISELRVAEFHSYDVGSSKLIIARIRSVSHAAVKFS